MRVLIACEFSGTVREAFKAQGHDAWSCDMEPTEVPGQHIQGDCLEVLSDGWDLMIAHPPCTHLCVSGAVWFPKKQVEQAEALEFVRKLMAAPIERWCIENPVSIISTSIRSPDQIIHPWQFGHPEEKTTCLWMRRLPGLFPTKIVKPRYVTTKTGKSYPAWSMETFLLPKAERSKVRSRTFQGIADAMAAQWNFDPIANQPTGELNPR